ncbi:MAG TPA: hypothetical protein VKZ91_06580 [Woeseiaceae bacterium]|nr:hypothetical protein [Woeseiaceae bacterium]
MTTKRCAFLTMEETEGWFIDADLAIPPMQALGWTIEMVPWRGAGADWTLYDAVYIGTPWDYPEDANLFIRLLEQIDASGPVLVNPIELVRWGLTKTYLRDLEARGADIVPSTWSEGLSPGQLLACFDALASDRIIVKPVVSTNATDTFLLKRHDIPALEPLLLRRFENRAFVVQPFIRNIQVEGEFSLFYFSGAYSHAIRKVPRAPDFRVQEEHGASILAIEPEAVLAACADKIVHLVDPLPVYARCDLVRGPDDRFLLMELELIEPSMYLRMNADAPQRFAQAFDRYVQARNSML